MGGADAEQNQAGALSSAARRAGWDLWVCFWEADLCSPVYPLQSTRQYSRGKAGVTPGQVTVNRNTQGCGELAGGCPLSRPGNGKMRLFLHSATP